MKPSGNWECKLEGILKSGIPADAPSSSSWSSSSSSSTVASRSRKRQTGSSRTRFIDLQHRQYGFLCLKCRNHSVYFTQYTNYLSTLLSLEKFKEKERSMRKSLLRDDVLTQCCNVGSGMKRGEHHVCPYSCPDDLNNSTSIEASFLGTLSLY
jgi:hypothetical protein